MKAAILSALCLGMAACASAPPKAVAPPAAAAAPPDPSYDWHGLLAAPMGSLLKEMPVTLHEVLLFRDEDKRAAADEGDCYAIDATAPTFIARVPEQYLLCFKHDRLAHIEASSRVPQEEAAKIFADACGLWFKNAALPAPAIAAATESTPSNCSGQDGAVAFSGGLELDPEALEAVLSITIDAVEQR